MAPGKITKYDPASLFQSVLPAEHVLILRDPLPWVAQTIKHEHDEGTLSRWIRQNTTALPYEWEVKSGTDGQPIAVPKSDKYPEIFFFYLLQSWAGKYGLIVYWRLGIRRPYHKIDIRLATTFISEKHQTFTEAACMAIITSLVELLQ